MIQTVDHCIDSSISSCSVPTTDPPRTTKKSGSYSSRTYVMMWADKKDKANKKESDIGFESENWDKEH